MTVEQALIDLGERPLGKSPYSTALLTILNAYLPGDHPVDPSTSAQQALSHIYRLKDRELQERLLEKRVSAVRSRDAYRTTLLVVSGVLGCLTITMAMAVILDSGDPTRVDGVASWLFRFTDGVFGTLKWVLSL